MKEYYFYLDATPTPQPICATSTSIRRPQYPYARLVEENAGARATIPPSACSTPACSTTAATGTSRCATPRRARRKSTSALSRPTAAPRRRPCICCRRCGSATPGPGARRRPKPALASEPAPHGRGNGRSGDHPTLGAVLPLRRHAAISLYTENESNAERLWGVANASPYVKDAFHRRVVDGDEARRQPGADRHQVRRLARADVPSRARP